MPSVARDDEQDGTEAGEGRLSTALDPRRERREKLVKRKRKKYRGNTDDWFVPRVDSVFMPLMGNVARAFSSVTILSRCQSPPGEKLDWPTWHWFVLPATV